MFPIRVRFEVLALIGVKALILTAIYFFLVAPVTGPEPDRAVMQSHILGNKP